MAYVYDNSNSVHSDAKRKDATGKTYIKALAHGDLTAKTPYLVYVGYDGPRTMALFDTGVATATAAAHANRYQVGVTEVAVSSGTYGWLQVGGFASDVITATTVSTVGALFLWQDADVTCQTGVTATQAGLVNGFAVAYSSDSSAATHDMYLLDKYVYGLT